MKKLFSLLLLALLALQATPCAAQDKFITAIGTKITAISSLLDGGYYLLDNAQLGYIFEDPADAVSLISTTTLTGEKPSRDQLSLERLDNGKFVWKLHIVDGKYQFETAYGKYLPALTANNLNTVASTTPGNFTLVSTGGSEYPWAIKADGATFYLNGRSGINTGKQGRVCSWNSTTDSYSPYSIIPVTVVNKSEVAVIESDDKTDVWYNIVSAKTAFAGIALQANATDPLRAGALEAANPQQQWKVVARGDGTVNIINRQTGNFLQGTSVMDGAYNLPQMGTVAAAQGKALNYLGDKQYAIAGVEEDAITRYLNLSQVTAGAPDEWNAGTAKSSGFAWKFNLVETVVTGIVAPSVGGSEGGSYYDLYGRPVASPSKGGIYIINGKKIIIK